MNTFRPHHLSSLWPMLLVAMSCLGTAFGDEPRLNQIQVIGTHNSYHIAPTAAMLQLIKSVDRETPPTLDYTHRPLEEQFSELGIRQIELDVYADPEGGRFAVPLGYSILNPQGGAAGPNPDPDGDLRQPGFKVLHVPDVDYRTTVRTFHKALRQVRRWSDEHPAHVPLFVLIELKEETIDGLTPPIKFTPELLDEIDENIRNNFEPDKLVAPDTVREESQNLREAITKDGWPFLDVCRGRVVFILDNVGDVRDHYLSGHASLRGRAMFVFAASPSAPEAAFFKHNDPIEEHARIQKLVQQGFIVRTRADANTQEARRNDTRRREHAFSSGAQLISTDYPEPDSRFSGYHVRFPNGRTVRSNPVSLNEPVEIIDVPHHE